MMKIIFLVGNSNAIQCESSWKPFEILKFIPNVFQIVLFLFKFELV